MENKFLIFGAIVAILAILFVSGCAKEKEFTAVFDVKGCAEHASELQKAADTKATEIAGEFGTIKEEINISAENSNITLHHALNHACCLSISFEPSYLQPEAPNKIDIIEHLEGDPCRCMCSSRVNVGLGPFEKGTYIVSLYSDTTLLKTENVTIA